MRVYGYARVSTQEQAEEFDALNQQIARLKAAGATEVLIDIESGRNDGRKQYNELLKLAQHNQVEEIIITRVDRLGRSVIAIHKAIDIFVKHNVNLRILDAPVDPNSPFGWFSINQMSGLAEFESRLLSQRIKHGNNYFRQQLKYCVPPFGYSKDENQRLTPNYQIHEKSGKTYFELAKIIIDLTLSMRSLKDVCNYIYQEYEVVFSVAGLRDWVKNPALQGHTAYFVKKKPGVNREPIINFNTHPALITADTVAAIQNKLLANKKYRSSATSTRGEYPLAGLIKCVHCGGSMYRNFSRHKTKVEYIRCVNYNKPGKYHCDNSKCTRLREIIAQTIAALCDNAPNLINYLQSQSTTMEVINTKEIENLTNELSVLRGLRSSNPNIIEAIAKIEVTISTLSTPTRIVDKDAFENAKRKIAIASQATFWESLDDSELRSALAEFVEKVEVDSSGAIAPKFKLPLTLSSMRP
ncbi:recombinase family protein [Calothrix sp. FACHB-1219]|uniref:fdxN element excision recombinase XisF n=1 Tax=unclassified Calothrix TaxID=2619626 RepID=UPI00168A3C5B|nr:MULTISPECIES: fdxN element excision recombinase XisF [unclassified Calothrix]MBD2202791.1 recombinase family protein [Calothrix sp. FACHB-168]MBD2218944.1 recombinase family protein [Calothrix sp. FACHB-1219]